jgi:hypothetical protein
MKWKYTHNENKCVHGDIKSKQGQSFAFGTGQSGPIYIPWQREYDPNSDMEIGEDTAQMKLCSYS